MSDTTTQGIRVEVKTRYAPERSQPEARMHFFVYTITISNTGTEPAQLISRHWIITDATQHVEEVRGPGVVGQHPFLHPNKNYTYSSNYILHTKFGTMEGSYQMVRPDGTKFDAGIAPFLLALPHAVN